MGRQKRPPEAEYVERSSKVVAAISKPEWSSWERKIDKIGARDFNEVMGGWLAHIPEIQPSGSAPTEGLDSIAALSESFKLAAPNGDYISSDSSLLGARQPILHEAFFLAHKAIHVQLSAAEAVKRGRYTWALVDAYQASLFALGSILAFLGISNERDGSDFLVIDVWSPVAKRKADIKLAEAYGCQLIRFKTLDHFHKWALFKRVLRTLKIESPLVLTLKEALRSTDDKSFAVHRNTVHYNSRAWLFDDLLADQTAQGVMPAASLQEVHDSIYEGSYNGSVYLMCALIEFACMCAEALSSSEVVKKEIDFLNRRESAVKVFSQFAWNSFYGTCVSR